MMFRNLIKPYVNHILRFDDIHTSHVEKIQTRNNDTPYRKSIYLTLSTCTFRTLYCNIPLFNENPEAVICTQSIEICFLPQAK